MGDDKQTLDWFATYAEARANPNSTIKPRVGPPAKQFAAITAMARQGRPVVLGHLIGEGGSGQVHEAEQVVLGRTVAAKRLKEPDPAMEQALIQEAWIVGSLEHPNIVPVHEITIDEEDRLTLLLKRIEGETWTRWIQDPQALADEGVDDPLAWHLGVFIQVCNAVAFAHSRGIIHRDLKPDNVLIGRFGEVVVVDWGIAVSLGSHPAAPPVSTATVAGTPVYMSPEMLSAPDTIDVRTDVYLLGGILHEVLTGNPPHPPDELPVIRAHILEEDVHCPASVPLELAAIVDDCLARSPEARPESAESARDRVQEFLSHRASIRLTDDAEHWQARLHDAEDPEALFERARYGFTAALSEWGDNARASRGLQALFGEMCALRLAAGDLRGARRLIDEVESPDTELLAGVEAAEREAQRLAHLARSADPRIGADRRRILAQLLAVLWAAIPILGHLVAGYQIPTWRQLYGGAVLLMAVTLVLAVSLVRSTELSDLNQKLLGWVILTPVLQLLLTIGLDWMDLDPARVQAAHFFLWGTMVTTSAVAVDWRLVLPGAAYIIAFFVAIAVPEARYLIMAGPNALMALVVLRVFRI